jgi:O-acetyl-ADP-ribose deacetylase (regulator of RNase III)
MITFSHGNILEANVECIVIPVNCVGVMGAGLAKQYKEKYPTAFRYYRDSVCALGRLTIGDAFIYCHGSRNSPMYSLWFPTKADWRCASRIEDIKNGLDDMVFHMRDSGINSIAIPALGCGLGGLNWDDVKPLIMKAITDEFDTTKIEVIIYEPDRYE